MSKRPRNLSIDIPSDDDDDDDLLQTSFFRKTPSVVSKSATATTTAATLTPSSTTPQLTPLGWGIFPVIAAVGDSVVGEKVTMTLVEASLGHSSTGIRISNQQGQVLPIHVYPKQVLQLAPILRKSDKYHCRATRHTTDSLKVEVHAKANRRLGSFECTRFWDELQTHWGTIFVRQHRTPRTITPDYATSQGAVSLSSSSSSSAFSFTPAHISSSGVTPDYATSQGVQPTSSAFPFTPAETISSGVAVATPTPTNVSSHHNIRVDGEGNPYTAEQERIVANITANQRNSHYAVLQVGEQATLATIKKAYSSLARLVHPERNRAPQAAVAFRYLAQAYLVLSDPQQREAYDSQKPAARSAVSSEDEDVGFVDPFELFRDFFAEDDVDTIHVEVKEPDWENQKDSLEHMFDHQQTNQLVDIPEYDLPPPLAHLTLFDYQLTGIRWLIHQERCKKPPSWFVQEGSWTWRDKITGSIVSHRPRPLRGGILADEMGLGKTLQAIALILSNPPKGQTGYPYVPSRSPGRNVPRCTLIVCPLTVISNWSMQIKRHVNRSGRKDVLKVGIYHGPNRKNMIPSIEANYYDIVLTSYPTLAYEFKQYIGVDEDSQVKRKKKVVKCAKYENETFLFDLWLHRIVLDEAHIIRNSKAYMFKAIKQLQSTYKLAVTGTPFVNRPDDIHSLLSFLGALPLAKKEVFQRFVTDKIRERKEVGMSVLRTAMAHVSLRRRKETVANTVKLVERKVHVVAVDFEEGEHKVIHDVLYSSARAVLDSLFDIGDDVVLENYMHFIALILRIRQAACHVSLIPAECRDRAHDVLTLVKNRGKAEMAIEEAEDLLDRLRGALDSEEKMEECAVCFEVLDEESTVVLRTCQHIFCRGCLNQVTNSCCPLCRASYTPDDMVSKVRAETAVKNNQKKKTPMIKRGEVGQSPKLKMLFRLIGKMKPDEKGVIFSQWTSLLDIVQRELQEFGYTFTRIDGSMNAQARIEAMERFDTKGCDTMRTPRFILCSLHACGVGVNLERGNVAFLLDPWWNAAVEQQAMSRVHRISSTRPVRVYRLVMDETLEQRMLGLQHAKEMLGKGTMQRLSPEEKRKARLTALRDLFDLPENLEKDWVEW